MNNTTQILAQQDKHYKRKPLSSEVLEAIQSLQICLHEDRAEYAWLNPRERQHYIGKAIKVLMSLSFDDFLEHMRRGWLLSDLCHSGWITRYHRFSLLFPHFLLSDGTKAVADHGGLQWLFEKIAVLQNYPTVKYHPKRNEHQVWRLKGSSGNPSVLTCEYENNKVIYEESMGFTNCPHDFLEIWVQSTCFAETPEATAHIALLPVEI
ncbi:DUF6876 family protein [Pantanalinema rosaneae CENA516]|uniref:DUF6876 family protein n=1 Tax=Pantanalinema rosaneae TaxID=1620701 RepID=UPI003D6FB84C